MCICIHEDPVIPEQIFSEMSRSEKGAKCEFDSIRFVEIQCNQKFQSAFNELIMTPFLSNHVNKSKSTLTLYRF